MNNSEKLSNYIDKVVAFNSNGKLGMVNYTDVQEVEKFLNLGVSFEEYCDILRKRRGDEYMQDERQAGF